MRNAGSIKLNQASFRLLKGQSFILSNMVLRYNFKTHCYGILLICYANCSELTILSIKFILQHFTIHLKQTHIRRWIAVMIQSISIRHTKSYEFQYFDFIIINKYTVSVRRIANGVINGYKLEAEGNRSAFSFPEPSPHP